MAFRSRLLQVMHERNLRQVDVLELTKRHAKEYGVTVSKTNISNYVNGKNEPDHRRLMLLAKALNVNESWLIGLDVPRERQEDVERLIIAAFKELSSKNKLNLLSYAERLKESQTATVKENVAEYQTAQEVEIQSKLSAGTGTLDLDPEHTEKITYNGAVPFNYDLAFEVSGNSMTPTFENGEIVFIKKQINPTNGAIMALTIDGEAFLKKVYVESDKLRLVSLNPAYNDIIADATNDIRIIGKVVFG